ncbi:MAG: sigma-70 family RNA polymerase sigma factor [Planctomycetes bacterium]|nr:sigma-70 family RNA polymerase sigma factor [Planctomycetota bacterium]
MFDAGVEELSAAEGKAQGKDVLASADPIRRYLIEATRTPLLTVAEERRLAQRMARRRTMFLYSAASIPSLWPMAARLVREVLRGQRPAMKVFMIGGVSEKEFHRHLETASRSVPRLEEIAAEITRHHCRMHGQLSQKKLWREGKELCAGLLLRLPTLHKLVKLARRTVIEKAPRNSRGRPVPCSDCLWRIRRAGRLYDGFVETRNALVCANLRLVVFIARQVARHPSQILELIQEGNYGLLYAAEKYDAREKCQFHSYAYWWIRQAMTRAIANKSRLIRTPVNLQDAPARVREEIARFKTEVGRDPTPEELSAKLDLTRGEAERVFRRPVRCFSLDQLTDGDEDASLSDVLPDPRPAESSLDSRSILEGLEQVLATLLPREREILLLRFGLGHDQTYTLEDIAKIYGLSRERIRQIEIKALEKLRQPKRARRLLALRDALLD